MSQRERKERCERERGKQTKKKKRREKEKNTYLAKTTSFLLLLMRGTTESENARFAKNCHDLMIRMLLSLYDKNFTLISRHQTLMSFSSSCSAHRRLPKHCLLLILSASLVSFSVSTFEAGQDAPLATPSWSCCCCCCCSTKISCLCCSSCPSCSSFSWNRHPSQSQSPRKMKEKSVSVGAKPSSLLAARPTAPFALQTVHV